MESDRKFHMISNEGGSYVDGMEVGSGDHGGGEEEDEEERPSVSGGHGPEECGQCWDFVEGLLALGFQFIKVDVWSASGLNNLWISVGK